MLTSVNLNPPRSLRRRHTASAISLFVTFFVSGICCQSAASQATYADKIKIVRPAIVEVLISGVRRGTGFCISSDGRIVTATHVVGTPEATTDGGIIVKYERDLEVRFGDGHTIAVLPLPNPSPEGAFHEISVLKADEKTPHFLKLGELGSVVDGDEVYMIGFPFDVPVAVSYRGNVSAQFPMPAGTLRGKPVQNSTIHVQMPVAKGFSGSPLLRMSDDLVVGVITNKLGGINPELNAVRQNIGASPNRGGVSISGVNPNDTFFKLINVLDNFLSAGAGWAVSTEYAKPLIEK
jgi:S1-C subfamily serine protease